MKAAGAALVVLACTWYGFNRASVLSGRARCLAAFMESLRFIEAELASSAAPLPELFLRLSESGRAPVRGFYRRLCGAMDGIGEQSLFSLWQEALRQEAGTLSDFQRSELARPGAMLGRYDFKEQAAAIESCISRLEPELQRANDKAREGLRLYTGLGLVSGIMAAAVML